LQPADLDAAQSKVERQADDGMNTLGCGSASVNAFNNRATFSGVEPRSSDALLQCAGNEAFGDMSIAERPTIRRVDIHPTGVASIEIGR